MGGAGAFTVAPHIRTDLLVQIADAVVTSRLVGTRRQHVALLPLIHTLFAEPDPGPQSRACIARTIRRRSADIDLQTSTPCRPEIVGILDRLHAID